MPVLLMETTVQSGGESGERGNGVRDAPGGGRSERDGHIIPVRIV